MRGYFSDVAAVPLESATSGPSADRTTGAGAGAAHQPFAYAFKSAGGGSAALARKLHAHAEHGSNARAGAAGGGGGGGGGTLSASTAAAASANVNADVAERALQPKVFVQHSRAAGAAAVPRRVAVERRRREFAEASLEELLRQRGIDYGSTPGGDTARAHSASTAEHTATLPLEAFDSSDFEVRPEAAWVALGVDDVSGQQRGVPGQALCLQADGTGDWRPCRAVAWDARAARFAVAWTGDAASRTRSNLQGHIAAGRAEEGKAGGGLIEGKEGETKADADLQALVPGATGGVARVLRIHLCFAAEDPVVFADRLAHAFKSRREAAQLIRYQMYVDCMPVSKSAPNPGIAAPSCGARRCLPPARPPLDAASTC